MLTTQPFLFYFVSLCGVCPSSQACVCAHGLIKSVGALVYTATEKECASVVKMGDRGCLGLPVTSALTGPVTLERVPLT